MPFRDPEQPRVYQREYRQLRRAGRIDSPGRAVLLAPLRLRTAREILALVEEQVNAVRADPALRTIERARCVGSLAGVALRAVETPDPEARVEAVEAVLHARPARKAPR
jgi:hypothetical protein